MTSCGNPDVEKDAVMLRKPKFDGQTKICVKCKETMGNIVVRYAVYCKACFFSLVQTRFRKTLEPTINLTPDGPRRKALKAAGSLLIGYSGGTASTTLLDLVAKTYFSPPDEAQKEETGISEERIKEKHRGGKEHPRNKDSSIWKGRSAVCYVDISAAFSDEVDRTDEIRQVVESYPSNPFDFIPLRLEDAFDSDWWSRVGGSLSSTAKTFNVDLRDEDLRLDEGSSVSGQKTPCSALGAYLSSLPTHTARHSSIQTLVRLLLLHTAASRTCSHLLLGTSLTTLSINLISGIAQGAGFSVPNEAQEEWTPRPDRGMTLRVIRPLRDVGMKECAIWAWWHGLNIVGGPARLSGQNRNSIAALTKDFVVGLETDYPATVSTIARTCAKLAPKEGSDGACILCERPAQQKVHEWKASISIRAYQDAAFAVMGNARPPHLTEEEVENLIKRSADAEQSHDSLSPYLCYACHTTLTSRSSRGTSAPLPLGLSSENVPLPMWVRSTLTASNSWKLSSKEMEAHIASFILPED